MKNSSLYIISVLSIILLGLGVYIWFHNFKEADILRTKNDTYTNIQVREIQESQHIEFVKEKAIEIIKTNKSSRHKRSDESFFRSKLILLQIVFILVSFIFSVIAILKRNT
ncbi:hypothetical protein [Tenacibaculum sp. M341]|uniref:hypothetical protein n=1 Tax=Tenacibaculum sp. M341 TaxID=2530339 RepID=UPI00104E9FE8|nr:hypothetical protein [Tenacibaculum sp. M341]TCI85120.1 hypothetical protein EYW44_18370 [Tenacibaculum sp. M341]